MKESSDKMQSEFEEKLRQSESAKNNAKPVVDERRTIANETAKTPETAEINTTADQQPRVIPVVEEQIRVHKKTVETGSVHVSKDVHEEEVTVDVPTVHEEVNVERIAINKYVDSPPPPVRHEGDVMIISVLEEEVVVTKRLKLVEEVHVTKRKHETKENQHITLRKEEVKVNRVDLNNENPNKV
ncbi:YsnF/AvaK domain-containing protein [Pontibacter pamirensis]|uniref:YsnF/AvaK domain-containing protein n=1 Tax=Pontibacter pamirensis TaxID=2562824 RepID=UPI001F162D78|nr:YsnF/AvaK domain-containing protein [Pontibacter pamirensis]